MDEERNRIVNRLLRQIAEGSADAVSILYTHTRNGLLAVAYRYTSDVQMCEDCLAELFGDIPRLASRYRVGKNGFNLMCKQLKFFCLNKMKQEKRHAAVPIDALSETELPSQSDAREEYADLRYAVGTLPDDLRRIVYLRYVKDLTLSECARVLGVGAATVMRRQKSAERLLYEQLNGGEK